MCFVDMENAFDGVKSDRVGYEKERFIESTGSGSYELV